jgi:hypothetical protein
MILQWEEREVRSRGIWSTSSRDGLASPLWKLSSGEFTCTAFMYDAALISVFAPANDI